MSLALTLTSKTICASFRLPAGGGGTLRKKISALPKSDNALISIPRVQAWTSSPNINGQLNVAQGGLTSCLSTYAPAATYASSKAVDGVLQVLSSAETFYHSLGNGPLEYWMVDLGATYILQNLTFFNRAFNTCGVNACNTRSVGYTIFALNADGVLSSPIFTLTSADIQSFPLAGACPPSATPSPAPTPGGCVSRYLRVLNVNSGQTMNFDELEAYTSDGLNVASGKPVVSTSCYQANCAGYGPNFVVDGFRADAPGFFNSNGIAPGESVTVDLGSPGFVISYVTFYNRQSACCQTRSVGTQLQLLDASGSTRAAFNLTGRLFENFSVPYVFCPTLSASSSLSVTASPSRSTSLLASLSVSASVSASKSVSATLTASPSYTATNTGTATGTATGSLTAGASGG